MGEALVFSALLPDAEGGALAEHFRDAAAVATPLSSRPGLRVRSLRRALRDSMGDASPSPSSLDCRGGVFNEALRLRLSSSFWTGPFR
eukprot:8361033-Alexandrium_andersonii.AAC.1